jgi:uncharacterized peroxidase-related enzyme
MQALLVFAEKPTRQPRAIRTADMDRLRQMGLDDRAILDACSIIAYFNHANRVTLGLGVET